jgi:hypothetical protein
MRKIIFVLLSVAIYSCEPPVKKVGDNPKVSYYIVGRLKTTEIDTTGMPFKVKIISLNSKLIEKPFSIEIMNENDFHLSYYLNDKKEEGTYNFGEEINTNDIHFLISKTKTLDSVTCVYLKDLSYQFQIKGEE